MGEEVDRLVGAGYPGGASSLREPYQEKGGCSTGCLKLAAVLVAAVVGLGLLFPRGCTIYIPGPYLPPVLTVERTLDSSVVLDADHPSAIQRFTVTAIDAGESRLSAYARSDAGTVGLTILVDDDGGRLFELWSNYRSGAGNDVVFRSPPDRAPPASRRYLAVVELVDPSAAHATAVTLEIRARSSFVGPMSTPAASPTTPPDFRLELSALGALETAQVSTIRSTYRETIKIAGGTWQRALTLRLAGAALPVSAGGSGRLMLVATAVDYTMPDSGGEMGVHGAIQPLAIATNWNFYGSVDERYADTYRGSGGDPSPLCEKSGNSCQIDLGIDLEPYGMAYAPASATPEPVPMTLTFEVVAIDFFIGIPGVPDGASISLTSPGPPLPSSAP